jgi:hypothetical protein
VTTYGQMLLQEGNEVGDGCCYSSSNGHARKWTSQSLDFWVEIRTDQELILRIYLPSNVYDNYYEADVTTSYYMCNLLFAP